VNLTTHITDVATLLIYEDLSEVVLVGNSYAGMVITGVAATAPERLKTVVYLDAYVPDEGESEQDLWPAEMRDAILSDGAALKGLRQPPPPSAFGITDPELAEWVKARWTPHPLATYTEPVPHGNALSAALSRVFIQCTGDPSTTLPVFATCAAKASARGWPVYEIETGHVAMLTAPREVAQLLDTIASTN
jgi:pimeloyl-ACP methyl ester carboxylesterase